MIRNLLSVVALTVAIIALVACGWTNEWWKKVDRPSISRSTSPKPEKPKVVPSGPIEGVLGVLDGGKFTYIMPPKWQIAKMPGIAYDPVAREGFSANIVVLGESCPDMDLDEYSRLTVDNIKVLCKATVTEPLPFTNDYGLKAKTYRTRMPYQGMELTQTSYIFDVEKGTKWLMTCTCKPAQFTEMLPIFERSARTFRLKP